MAIDFEELQGSPRLRIGQGESIAQRVFRVAWDDWQAFSESLVGGWRETGGAYTYLSPIAFPGLSQFYVDDLEIDPFDPGNPVGDQVESVARGTNIYPAAGARVTATYRARGTARLRDQPPIQEGTFLTYQAHVGVDQSVAPGRDWVWESDTAKLPGDMNLSLLVPIGTFSLTWHMVARPPWQAIRQLRGQINNTPFLDVAAERVLFLGARVRREFEFLDQLSRWVVTYEFAEHVSSWNQLRRPGVGFARIEDAVSGATPYESGNFEALFQFGS